MAGIGTPSQANTTNVIVTSGTVTANQGNPPWQENLVQVSGVSVTLGQKVMASSFPVVFSSDQSSIPVTGTFWQATQPVSIAGVVTVTGTVTANQGTANATPWNENIAQINAHTVLEAGVNGSLAIGGNQATNNNLSANVNPVLIAGSDYGGTAKIQNIKVDSLGKIFGNTIDTITTVSTVSAVTSITNALPAGSNVIGHVITDSGSVTNATLSAETTKVIGTVNQGTSPWIANATLQTQTDTVMVGGVNIKEINAVTPLMGNGTTGTGSLRVTIASDNTAFAVNATLSAETTKVIGTVNQGTSPWAVSLAAETTKVIGVVRTSDGAGNLLTSNSTTYTAKFGLDTNLLGVLGTAFSTAGKVDVKGADGDVFVRQATGTNLHTVVDSGTITTVSTVTSITNSVTVAGGKTNNNAAPLATNVGALVGIANAAQQSWTEGNEVLLSTNLKGSVRTIIQDAALNDRGVNVNASNQMAVNDAANATIGSAPPTIVVEIGGIDNFTGVARAFGVTEGAGDANNGKPFFPVSNWVYNGATWDRVRGDTTGGMYVQMKGGVMPSGTSLNTSASRITTNTTTTIVSATAYISSVVITTETAGTTSTIKIQDKGATPKILVDGLITTAINTTPSIMNFQTPILMTSGIDIITAGAVAATVDVWINYFT